MLKKTLTYENVDGQEVTEDFYFNLTKVELAKQLQLEGDKDGLDKQVQKIVDDKATPREIMATFEDLIVKSYGERTSDGKFVKTAQTTESFLSSEAYSNMFFELITDAGKAAEFFNGIMPKDLVEEAKRLTEQQSTMKGLEPTAVIVDEARQIQDVPLPAKPKKGQMSKEEILAGMRAKVQPQVLTYEDVVKMSQADLDAALAAGATLEQ